MYVTIRPKAYLTIALPGEKSLLLETEFHYHDKLHFPLLLQVSHYTFAMCSYREKQAEPTEMMQLDGYTVDYCEAVNGRPLI